SARPTAYGRARRSLGSTAARRSSGREAEPYSVELLGHPRPDDLQGGSRTDQHLELGDEIVLVERELVDPLDLFPVDLGRELEHRDAVVGVLELHDVAESPAAGEHSLGRS